MNITSEQFATATKLDYLIWEVQNKVKITKLPTMKPKKSHVWCSVTKK